MAVNSTNMNNVSINTQKTYSDAKGFENKNDPYQENIDTNQSDKSSKLNTVLKCLGVAAAAGLAIYGGSKAIKYLKGKTAEKMINNLPTIIPKTNSLAHSPKSPLLLGNGAKILNPVTMSSTVSTFKGKTGAEIVRMYKAGDKSLYRELARLGHPDSSTYNSAFKELFSSITTQV